MKAKATTPATLNKDVIGLCAVIDATQTPSFVPVTPQRGCLPNECYENVRMHVEKNGGRIQHGWQIWEIPGIFIEGEFHAVWMNPDGKMIDITPKDDGEQQIVFLPDSKRVYRGQFIDNVRKALVDNDFTRNIIRRGEKMTALKLKYDKGNGVCEIPVEELAEALELQPQIPFTRVATKTGRNDPCPCGSGKKYKKCCGR